MRHAGLVKRMGTAVTWGLWSGLVAVLAHALAGSTVTSSAWVIAPLAATVVFWCTAWLPGRVWTRVATLMAVQWAGHLALQSLHVDGAGAGLHVHGAPVDLGEPILDLAWVMLASHIVVACCGLLAALLFGPAGRRLVHAGRRLQVRRLPSWRQTLLAVPDISWRDLRDSVSVSGRAPPCSA